MAFVFIFIKQTKVYLMIKIHIKILIWQSGQPGYNNTEMTATW